MRVGGGTLTGSFLWTGRNKMTQVWARMMATLTGSFLWTGRKQLTQVWAKMMATLE